MSQRKKNFCLLTLFFLIFGLYAILKGQEFSFDFLNYHFYNGFAFLNHRLDFDYAAAGVQTYFNPLLDAFDYWLISHFNDPRLLRFILGGICGLNGFFLFKICEQLFDTTFPRWIALIIGVTSSIFLSQVGSVMNDAQAALPVMIGLLLLLKHRNLGGGLFLGIATGLKLTNGIFILAVSGALLLLWVTRKTSLRSLIVFGIGIVLGFAITDGWWMHTLYRQFGNPFFPYYNNIFHSPFFGDSTLRDTRFGMHTLGQALALPFRLMAKNSMLVVEPTMRDWRLGLFFVFTLLFVLRYAFKKHRSQLSFSWLFIFAFIYLSYFIWVFEFGIYRYLIPVALLLGPCIVILTLSLTLKRSQKTKKTLLILLTLLLIVTTIRPDFGHLKHYDKHFITVNAPPIPDNAVVFVADAGESFVLPFLNPQAHFINPSFPHFNEKYSNPNTFYILTSPFNLPLLSTSDFYEANGFVQGPCQMIATNALEIYDKHQPVGSFELCIIKKANL